jgi:type II secretory pathway component PulF
MNRIFSEIFKEKEGPLKPAMMAFFFHQLAVMTSSGITLVGAWKLILPEISPAASRRCLERTAQLMEGGIAPSQAMEQSGLFPLLACNLMRAGENSGTLDNMLSLLGDYYEGSERQKQNLINALAYPVFLIFCTLVMMVGTVFFVLPIFEELFLSMAVPLPGPTKLLLKLSSLVRAHALYAVPLVLAIAGLASSGLHSPERRLAVETFLLKSTILHRLCIAWCWQRYSHILSVQLAGGMPLLAAMDDAVAVVPLCWFRHEMEQIKRDIESGQPFSVALECSACSTAYLVTMLVVGESTGNYEDILLAVKQYYEWHLGILAKRLKRLLEPCVLLVVGTAIGILVICLLLPMFDAAASMTLRN